MPKATVQKYPQDETVLHSAIQALVDYFDQIADSARKLADREENRAASAYIRQQQARDAITRS